MSVSCECRVFSGGSLCVGLITRPENPTDCGVPESYCEISIIRKSWSNGFSHLKKEA